MAKITSLTDKQKALFPVWVEKWTNIGLSTEPMDRERAARGVALAYAAAGLPVPRVVFSTSPMAGAIWYGIVTDPDLRKKLKVELGKSVGDSVWASVGDSVGARVGASVWASVRDSVGASVGESGWASV